MNDVVAGLQVLEGACRFTALAGASLAMGAAPAGEIGLRNDRDLCVGQRDAAVEWSDHDRTTSGKVDGLLRCADFEVETLVEEQRLEALG